MEKLLILALLLFPSLGQTATIVGTDYGNTDLIPANGDTLQGTFTNVRLFEVGPGTTAFVATGTPLVIYATTITIRGILDASGRGKPGGSGGPALGAGFSGDGGGSSAEGGGGAGGFNTGVPTGGGGGGAGGAGGIGAGRLASVRGDGGTAYGSTGTITIPISADDMLPGSGGGGGSGNGLLTGGAGASGGGSIYLEASSVTVMGSGRIRAGGFSAASVVDTDVGNHPGAGGGGSGGTVIIRAPGAITLSNNVQLDAPGGRGGDVVAALTCGTHDPGGGGAGGRIKIFHRGQSTFQAVVSTAAGQPGSTGGFCDPSADIDTPRPVNGSSGTISFGIVATSPTALSAQNVFVTSIAWSWTATPSFGDGLLPAYRLFPSTATQPLPSPQLTIASNVTASTETALAPNTTYHRVLTGFSTWGDSLFSNVASAYTLANNPGASSFAAMADTSVQLDWSAGTPANPNYTTYELNRSTDSAFGIAVSTSFVVGVSSTPTDLRPNTTYHFRVRAISIPGALTNYNTTITTATLAAVPTTPALAQVHITSIVFSWSQGANPGNTEYDAQISTDNFFTLVAATRTTASPATFIGLSPGTQYFMKVRARNHNSVSTAYSTTISTTPGSLSNTTVPTPPGTPSADRQFSYDGAAVFSWSAAAHPIGILDYFLDIGSAPGAIDFFSGTVGNVLTYSASGLLSGRTYYARVRARTNAGTLSEFTAVSGGVTVFVPSQTAELAKPINWPNPFDPNTGPTNIGFVMSESGSVAVKIFTLQGEPVYETSRAYGSAGNQILTWDGRNGSGRLVGPGGYIVMIEKKYGSRTDKQRFKMAVLY